MKFFLYIIFICIVVLSSCQSKSKGQETIYTIQLKNNFQLSLPIDENTYFLSKSIFQFEEDGKEYLYFENRQKSMYDIIIFDLENQIVSKRIPIQREGSNGIPAMMGSKPFFDSNNLMVFQHNISRISFLNGKGEVIRNFPIKKEGYFIEFNLSSYFYMPTFAKDSVIYISQRSKGKGKRVGYDKIPLFISFNQKTGEIDWLPLYFPTNFDGDYTIVKGEDAFSYDYNNINNQLICSFTNYDSIMVTENLKDVKWYNAKSRYLKNMKPNIDNHTNDIYGLIKNEEKPKYLHLMYDKYRNVYYRFAEMPCKLAKDETPYDNFAPKAREFSVIILNDKFEIIGETKFPGNKYFYRMSFVGKDGLYISENNLANPEFDENKLVFSCFKLVDINE